MKCELCGAEQFEDFLTRVRDYISDETFAIRRCAKCGLCVTDPAIGDDVIERYYPPRYRTDRQKYSGGMRVKLRAQAVEGAVNRTTPGRLLDLGCGTGAFAMEMKRRGWTVAVTEINDAVLADLREQGMEAKRPDEAMRDGFAAPFDAITCWHVLEHVEHPLELSKWARGTLAAGGIFQATVPNLASWQARMFGRDWLHLDPPRHRFHFTPGTLGRLLVTSGLEIVRSSSVAMEYDLFGVVQSALNRVCSRPNVLFEHLTARGQLMHPLPMRDVIVSYAAAPFLSALAMPMVLASMPVGRGGTLTVTCRAGTAAAGAV